MLFIKSGSPWGIRSLCGINPPYLISASDYTEDVSGYAIALSRQTEVISRYAGYISRRDWARSWSAGAGCGKLRGGRGRSRGELSRPHRPARNGGGVRHRGSGGKP